MVPAECFSAGRKDISGFCIWKNMADQVISLILFSLHTYPYQILYTRFAQFQHHFGKGVTVECHSVGEILLMSSALYLKDPSHYFSVSTNTGF